MERQFIWHVLPGASTLEIKKHTQKHLNEQNPETSDHRIIFMSLLNDIEWTKKVNTETCLHNAKDVAAFAAQFKPRHWCFVGPASENTWWNEKLQRTSKKMKNCRIADG